MTYQESGLEFNFGSVTTKNTISENYRDPFGRFRFYDTLNNLNNEKLLKQEHIDIRGFVPNNLIETTDSTMFYLDGDSIEALDRVTMRELDESTFYTEDDWTLGTVGPISFLNNTIGLTISGTAGRNVTSSTKGIISLKPENLTEFSATNINLALPNFPASKMILSGCYLAFSNATDEQKFFFHESTTEIKEGNVALMFPFSKLTILEPKTVTLCFETTEACNIYVTALRVLGTWTPLKLDINTEGHFLRQAVTVSGTPVESPALYTMYRANDPPSIIIDPKPINSDFGVTFYSGSLVKGGSITMYFRERREAQINQLDLDRIVTSSGSIGFTQEELDALGHQPDFGESIYSPRTQLDLDSYNQSQLDTYEQYQLERISETIDQAYIQAKITWHSNGHWEIGLSDYQNITGEFAFSFEGTGIEANKYYFFEVYLNNNTASVSLCPVEKNGRVQTTEKMFYSGKITNSSVFYRDAGRIGWNVELNDGDAFVKGFNSLDLIFAEYESKPFKSRTPVRGASLITSATEPVNLYYGAESLNGATLAINGAISNSKDGSIGISASARQGLITLPFLLTNLKLLTIKFDLYIPIATYDSLIPHFLLMNEDLFFYELFIGETKPNLWQTHEISVASLLGQPGGEYRFASVSDIDVTTTWYIDNLSITQKAITWAARSAEEDPWGMSNVPYLDFGNTLNEANAGIVFEPFGNMLQLRAQAHQADAIIDRYFLQPQYAQLGNLVFK